MSPGQNCQPTNARNRLFIFKHRKQSIKLKRNMFKKIPRCRMPPFYHTGLEMDRAVEPCPTRGQEPPSAELSSPLPSRRLYGLPGPPQAHGCRRSVYLLSGLFSKTKAQARGFYVL